MSDGPERPDRRDVLKGAAAAALALGLAPALAPAGVGPAGAVFQSGRAEFGAALGASAAR